MALTVFEEGRVSLDPQKALFVPVGAASPLWLLFAGAASAGVAYWWMTRWADRTNLEALFAKPAAPEVVVEAAEVVQATAEAVVDAAFETAETAAEAVVETVATVTETAAETTEAVVDAVAEAAPEPEPAPKTRTKVRPAVEPPTGE